MPCLVRSLKRGRGTSSDTSAINGKWVAPLLVLIRGLLLVACGRQGGDGSPGSWTERLVLSFGRLSRSAIVHLPPTGGSPMPVVIVFHGGSGTAEGMERISHFDDIADQNNFIAVYPQGYDRS